MSVKFSSSDPIPIEDKLRTTADIFSEYDIYYNNPCTITGELIYFCEKPTLTNAKKLLASYNIPLPLSTKLLNPKKAKKPVKITTTENKDGGAGDTKAIIKELFILDTMHDLIGSNSPHIIYKLFEKEITKMTNSIEIKQLFLKNSYEFTKYIYDYLCVKSNTIIFKSQVDLKSRKIFDDILFIRLQNITKLEFILDNFVASLKTTAGDESEGTLAFVACAFMLVLFANMKRLNLLDNLGDTIILYDGLFLHLGSASPRMDGNYIQRFLSLFLRSIKRITSVVSAQIQDYKPRVISEMKKQFHKPVFFNKYLDTDAQIISYPAKNVISINNNEYEILKSINSTNTISNTIVFPHNKVKFYLYIKDSLTTSNPNSKDLWYLNFLRDSYKADIAVLDNLVYMTHDRLAYLYYRLIGGKNGILLSENYTISI